MSGGRLWIAALAAALILPTALPASAQDEELTFEQRLIQGLLGGGSGPSIDYRERSPLVIPPARELPPPDASASAQRNTAWPQDPDQKRAAAGATRRPVVDAFRLQGNPLSPNEMRRGARAGAGRNQTPAVTLSDEHMGRPLTPSELGETRSVFGLITGSSRPADSATFTGEPRRTRLTQPPAGYQTPSSSQPYSAPKKEGIFKVPTFFDRGVPTKDQ